MEDYSTKKYNMEPVYYCKQCLSLRVMVVPGLDEHSFCDECDSTDIGETTIEEWEKMYEKKYGFKFLNK